MVCGRVCGAALEREGPGFPSGARADPWLIFVMDKFLRRRGCWTPSVSKLWGDAVRGRRSWRADPRLPNVLALWAFF